MDQKKTEDQEQTKEEFRCPLHLQNARMIKGKKWGECTKCLRWYNIGQMSEHFSEIDWVCSSLIPSLFFARGGKNSLVNCLFCFRSVRFKDW